MSVAGDVRALADDLAPTVARALSVTARDAKTSFNAVAAQAGGGDSRLSGVGKNGRKISARYDEVEPGLVVVRAVGPWQFVEYDRRGGYPIPKAKGKGKNRRRGRPRLRLGDAVPAKSPTGWITGPASGRALHRGNNGPWHRATPKILDAAADRIVGDILRTIDRRL